MSTATMTARAVPPTAHPIMMECLSVDDGWFEGYGSVVGIALVI